MRALCILIFAMIGLQSQSSGQRDTYFEDSVKPQSIAALISYCQVQWMPDEIDSFKAMPEKKAVSHLHYWRDSWISLWTYLVMDSSISREFKPMGIEDNFEKWFIILTSLHRKLNNQEINLAGQVARKKELDKQVSAIMKLAGFRRITKPEK